jgi:capsular exopolysaccharide synthesis family protein
MNDWLPNRTSGALESGTDYPVMPAVDSEGESASPLQIRRFFIFLKRYWWVPVLTLVMSLGVELVFLAFTPPTYLSIARVWETEKLQVPGSAAFTGDLATYYGTQIELLRSSTMRQLALARLQSSRTNTVPLGEDNKPLNVKLQVAQTPKSTVFAIQAACSNPEFAQAFLNALTVEYVEYKKNIRKLVSGDTLASISDQVLRLEKDLKGDQDALTAFQRTNNLTILQQEGTIAGAYLARLKTQLSDLKLESQLLAASVLDQNRAETGNTNESVLLADLLRNPNMTAPASPDHQSALREVEMLKIERAKLSRFLRPKHPKIVKLDAGIERAQKLVDIFHDQSREQLAAATDTVKMRIQGVESAIIEWEPKAVAANGLIAEAERLKANINRSQVLYDRLVGLLQSVDISRNIDQETLAILDPASPAQRSYRVETLTLALGAGFGVFVGLAIVLLMELRDDRFTSSREVREKFAGTILGQIPEVLPATEGGSLALLELEDARHAFAESYRNLRSALAFVRVEGERPRVILITSALPDEGKSTVAVNLARSLAFGGSRVLLIDGDLRNGRLHEALDRPAAPGLADLLQKLVKPNRVTQGNCLANLVFISRGDAMGNPADAFFGPQLDENLALWRKEFDYVLIDSSPVFAADDATTLAPKVDGTLFVVRSRTSRASEVRQALDLLSQRQAKVLGLVYNRADSSVLSHSCYKARSFVQFGPNML